MHCILLCFPEKYGDKFKSFGAHWRSLSSEQQAEWRAQAKEWNSVPDSQLDPDRKEVRRQAIEKDIEKNVSK